MELRPEEITKIIRAQIKNYESRLEESETGVVILVGDGIAKVSGLSNCMAGELLEFPGDVYGMAQNLEEDTVSVVILGSDGGIKEGDTVKQGDVLGYVGICVSNPLAWFMAAAYCSVLVWYYLRKLMKKA